MIRVAYINFWSDPRNDRWLSTFIDNNIEQTVEVHFRDNPDILIASCFGQLSDNIKNIQAGCKLLFLGENPTRYKPYDDFYQVRKYYDLIVGFRPSNGASDVVRFPHWLIYYPSSNIDDDNNIVDFIEREHDINRQHSKTLFATMVARKPRTGGKISREILYNEVSKHGPISAPAGRVKGNTHSIGPSYQDKINFIRQSVYTICPENSSYPGYCTEKVFHAAQAGCIPIYWGHDIPEEGIININKYCFADIHNKQETRRSITKCINEPDKYIQGDFFTKDAKQHVQQMYDNLTGKILQQLNK